MHKDFVISRLKPALATGGSIADHATDNIPAAVLVIIHYHNKLPYMILTKRSSGLSSHGGQISFPGGKYARGDSTLLDTALRETSEEIGIALRPEQVLGSLAPVRTLTSNFRILPFVTVQDSVSEPKALTSEVERVIDLPLVEGLASIEPDMEHYDASHSDVYKFTYKDDVIWGATARILKQLHELLFC